MKRVLCLSVLLLTGMCFASARESSSGSAGAADGIGPVFPSAQMSLQTSYPQAQSSWDLTTPEVERLIEENLSSESTLVNAKIDVKTDDSAVVLTGTVASDKQSELAAEIAKAYAGNRRIENQIKVSGA